MGGKAKYLHPLQPFESLKSAVSSIKGAMSPPTPNIPGPPPGDAAPAALAVQPEPENPPVVAPTIDDAKGEVLEEQVEEKRRDRRRGRASTILTGERGLGANIPTGMTRATAGVKQLLGVGG